MASTIPPTRSRLIGIDGQCIGAGAVGEGPAPGRLGPAGGAGGLPVAAPAGSSPGGTATAALVRRPVVWLPISTALVAVLLWRTRPWELGERLGRVDPALLVLALVIGQATPVLWAARSARLLARTGHRVSLASIVPITAFANTINNLTPGSVGEVIRLWFLRHRYAVDYRSGSAVVLVERVVAIGYLSASAVVLWLAATAGLSAAIAAVLLAALVALPHLAYRAGLRPSAIVAALPLGPLLGRERWRAWSRLLADLDRTIAELLLDQPTLAAFAASSAAIFAVSAVQVILVGRALGVVLDPLAAWGALGIATTAGVLSFLPFGLGATDLALVGLLVALAVEPATAAAVAFGYRLVSTLPYALEGVAAYAWLSASLPAHGLASSMRAAADELAAERQG